MLEKDMDGFVEAHQESMEVERVWKKLWQGMRMSWRE